ncbi:hypothetical protein [Nonomuraea sp. NPDC046570]|uniref:hypothetical protein n=1 Tax=Nonomuraea sp. NPDC046570 TaxID=3155255 RepID=UPI0033E4CADA
MIPGAAFLYIWLATDNRVSPQRLGAFATRQRLPIVPANGNLVIAYLRRTRMWRASGLAAGLTVSILGAALLRGTFGLHSFWLTTGWFAGVLLGELRATRTSGLTETSRPARGRGFALTRSPRLTRPRPIALAGIRLLSPAVSIFRSMSLAFAAVLIGRTVWDSFHGRVAPAERLWTFAALVVALAVTHLHSRLVRRPIAEETAERVAAEIAIRSRSAQVLATGGGVVMVWLALRGGSPVHLVGALLFGVPYPLIALYIGTRPFLADRAAEPWLPRVLAASAAAALMILFTLPETPASTQAVPIQDGSFTFPVVHAKTVTDVTTADSGRRTRHLWWVLSSATSKEPIYRAEGTAPLAVSGDGRRVAFTDRTTRKLVSLELGSGKTREYDGSSPVFSADSRHLAFLTPRGLHLVDLGSGHSVESPGLARIIGLDQDLVVATTHPREAAGAADTELVTLDHRGRVLTRVPFDPTLHAWLVPGGKRLLVLTPGVLVTMDPATGAVLDRKPIKSPNDLFEVPQVLGWKDPDHALIRISDDELHLLNMKSGKVRKLDTVAPADAVFAKVPE